MRGHSVEIARLRDQVAAAARADGSVLIVGETGTGKGLVARCVHDASRGATAPFVTVVCPAIAHEPQDFAGLWAAARGGSVLLDEVGDMPRAAQVDLLAVLRARSPEEQRTDPRLLSTTHVDLAERARAGELSDELFAHLCAVRIDVPPLRAHLADLPDLTVAFLDRAVARGLAPRGQPRLTPAALAILSSLSWQGNVRELENVLEHVVVTSRDERIEADSVRAALKSSSSRPR